MEGKDIQVSDDCIEPELLSAGAARPRAEGPGYAPRKKPGILEKAKAFAAAVLALLAIGLFMAGALLTSTVIGAVIGVPLLLLAALLFFILFRLLSTGSPFIFRRF